MFPTNCQIRAEQKNMQMVSDRYSDNPLIPQIPIQALFRRSNARSFNPQVAPESCLRNHGPKRFR